MDVWMNRWMDECMDKWMNEQIIGVKYEWTTTMDGWVDGNGCLNGRTDG